MEDYSNYKNLAKSNHFFTELIITGWKFSVISNFAVGDMLYTRETSAMDYINIFRFFMFRFASIDLWHTVYVAVWESL